MDFIKAKPPRPPSSSISPNEEAKEGGPNNDPFEIVTNTFKELYDYISMEGNNPSIFLDSDVSLFSLVNDTFLDLESNLVTTPTNSTSIALLLNTTSVHAKGFQDVLPGTNQTEDDFSDVLITTVTSIILGLMILITVIGEFKEGGRVSGSKFQPHDHFDHFRKCVCNSGNYSGTKSPERG